MGDTCSESTPSRPVGEDVVGYDPATETFHARFDTEFGDPVVAVVSAVAAVTNRDATAMPPLYATVDPEALADLVASGREMFTRIVFSYEDCRVTVSSDGTVVVEPPRE